MTGKVRDRLGRLTLAGYALPSSITDQLLSPALVVYMEKARANVRHVLQTLGGDPGRWRPHLKTTKIPEVWRILIDCGVRHFKCATTREAAVFLGMLPKECEVDLLVAYPMQGPNLARVADLARQAHAARVSVLSEHPDHARGVPEPLDVFVDVNPDMNRTGVPMRAIPDIVAVARAAGPRFRGLHFYDGHVRDADAGLRARRCDVLYRQLLVVRAALVAEGLRVGELITSGTPSFVHALGYEPLATLTDTVHRVSPGTVVFHDGFSDNLLPGLDLAPAAVLFSRVVSHPGPNLLTCDAGSKSLAAEAGDPAAFAIGHPDLEATQPSEEHLPMVLHAGQLPARGTPLYLVPRHVCPTVNLAERAVLIEEGLQPRIAEVAARAHEAWQRTGREPGVS